MEPIKDRHLDAPGEANRDKHINFLAEENGDTDPADEFNDEDNENEEDSNITGAGNDDDLEEQENNIEEDEDAVINDDDVAAEEDNGFFTDDDSSLQTKEENENDKSNHPSAHQDKVAPDELDEKTTLADKITVANVNEDILTPIKDDNDTDYTNNAYQAG